MTAGDRLTVDIERHRAAIVRSDLSRPIKTALESGIFSQSATFFDFGCGHGGDVSRIAELGFESNGWDPYFRPNSDRKPASIVNLGYVLNVIENATERKEALLQAWNLTEKVLVVSAQVVLDYLSGNAVAYGDGVITKRNTFQKVFEQEELKNYIDATIGVDAIPAGLGIFFVFRSEQDAESFRASRFHSRRSSPVVKLRIKNFDECLDLLKPLIDFVSERGRIPNKGELSQEKLIVKELGSINRAFKLIVDATSRDEWEHLIQRRKEDLSLYIALSKFSKRPRIGALPYEIQSDIKAFFGSYKTACEKADEMLFSLGQPGVMARTCQGSKIGKKLPDALYVHVSALDELDLILRLFEGCASRTVGRLDDVTLIKFHKDKPQISYLFYPDFDREAHPVLHSGARIDLRDLNVKYFSYTDSPNPPVLHRKETFLSPTYPLYEQFAILTSQEEAAGLLTDASTIGTKKGWQTRLQQMSLRIEGHQILPI